jgi:hypothetical protein
MLCLRVRWTLQVAEERMSQKSANMRQLEPVPMHRQHVPPCRTFETDPLLRECFDTKQAKRGATELYNWQRNKSRQDITQKTSTRHKRKNDDKTQRKMIMWENEI